MSELSEKNRIITEAYDKLTNNPEQNASRMATIDLATFGRKYGFRLLYILNNKSHEEMINHAARLLVVLTSPWESHDIPESFTPVEDSLLYRDARLLVANAFMDGGELLPQSGAGFSDPMAGKELNFSNRNVRLLVASVVTLIFGGFLIADSAHFNFLAPLSHAMGAAMIGYFIAALLLRGAK